MLNPIQEIYIVICIEATKYTIENGILSQLIATIESVIDFIPAPERTHLCFITYNYTVNFYTLNKETQSDVKVSNCLI